MSDLDMSDVSDGEIIEDLSEISSEDDFFENLKRLTARKLELEIQNDLVIPDNVPGEFSHFSAYLAIKCMIKLY